MFGTVDMSGRHLNGASEHDECYSLYLSLSLFLSDECLKKMNIWFVICHPTVPPKCCTSTQVHLLCVVQVDELFISCTMFVMEEDCCLSGSSSLFPSAWLWVFPPEVAVLWKLSLLFFPLPSDEKGRHGKRERLVFSVAKRLFKAQWNHF